MVAVGDACKHIVQIVQLLDERKLSFSFCLNRNELLIQAGFGLLYQNLDLAKDGKLIKDCNRLVFSIMDLLDRGNASGLTEFKRIAYNMAAFPRTERMPAPTLSRHNSDGHKKAPTENVRVTSKSKEATASRFSPSAGRITRQELQEPRRATLPTISPTTDVHAGLSSMSLASPNSEPNFSPLSHRASFSTPNKRRLNHAVSYSSHPNIDYLSFGTDPVIGCGIQPNLGYKKEVSGPDWERLLSSLDNGQTNIYDTIYGGPSAEALLDLGPLSASAESDVTWSSNLWNWGVSVEEPAPPPQSVLSLSDESLTSGDEFGSGSCDYGPTHPNDRIYSGILIPGDVAPTRLGGMNVNLGL